MNDFSEFRCGFKPLFGALVGAGCGITSIMFYTHGTFVVAISENTEWSRGEVQFAFTIMSLMALFTAPSVGWMVDRFGPRSVALVSLVGFFIGCLTLSLTGTNLIYYYTGWAVLAVLGAGTLPITWTTLINKWFTINRGLALGITLSGTGIAASVAPSYASWLITQYDWQTAYLLLGATSTAIALPMVYLFFHYPIAVTKTNYDQGNTPDLSEIGLSLKEAVSGYKFWILSISIIFVSGSIAGLITNIVPLLTDKSLSVIEASGYTGLIGISVIIGRLGIGYLMDRIWAPLIAAIFLTLPAIGAMMLVNIELQPLLLSISIILIGLAAGAEIDLFAYLSSRYFGLKNYGVIYGIIFMIFSVSAGIAPAVFGFSFDRYGSYDFIFSVAAILSLMGGLSMLLLGAYPQFDLSADNNELEV